MLQHARQRRRTRFALALIDLDRFKAVNDVYGHAAGDRLLAEVGARLGRLSGPLIKVGRLGGDEFVAMLGGDPDDAAILAFGTALCAARCRDPYRLGDSAWPTPADRPAWWCTRAAARPRNNCSSARITRCTHAKQTRTGQAVLFSEQHESMIRDAVHC